MLANGDGQKEDYGGPGIPYGEKIVPSDLVDDDEDEGWHWGQGGEEKGLIPQLANDAETGVALCWDLIRNVSGQDPLHIWWCTRISYKDRLGASRVPISLSRADRPEQASGLAHARVPECARGVLWPLGLARRLRSAVVYEEMNT